MVIETVCLTMGILAYTAVCMFAGFAICCIVDMATFKKNLRKTLNDKDRGGEE